MVISVRKCEEPITQPRRLKVKVIVQGHRIDPWVLILPHTSFTSGSIWTLKKCSSQWGGVLNPWLSCADSMSRLILAYFFLHLRVIGFSLAFCVRSITPLPLEGFSYSVWEMAVYRTHDTTTHIQGQCHSQRLVDLALNLVSAPYLFYLCLWKDFH